MFTVRPSFSATPIFFCNMLGRGDLACEGMSSAGLPRRLPFGQPRPIQVIPSGCGSREALGTSRLENQPPKIGFGSNSGLGISWHTLANSCKYNVPPSKQETKHKQVTRPVFRGKSHQPPETAKSAGAAKLRQLCHSPRKTTLSKNANLSATLQQNTTSSKTAVVPRCVSRDKVVARSHKTHIANTQKTCYPFPCDGRFGLGLGCAHRRKSNVRDMGNSPKKMALQQKRAICSHSGNQNECEDVAEVTRTDPVRQSYSNCIYPEGGRNQIVRVTSPNIQTVTPYRQVQHNPVSPLSTGEIQFNSGQVITRKNARGMASSTSSNRGSISQVGASRNRLVCDARNRGSKKLRVSRLQRSISKLYRCLQQTMEPWASMGISSSQLAAQSFDTPEQCKGHILGCGPRVASSVLASRPEIQSSRSPVQTSEPVRDHDRCDNITASPTNTDIDPESLENWGWGAQIKDWSTQEKELLKKSWRRSTLSTYLSPLRRWLRWCSNSQVNSKSPQPADIAKFLMFLFLKENLSYSTILVHKSAVLTFCGPHVEQKTFSNFIIKHTLKAIGVAKPKEVRPLITWDPRIVLNWLSLNARKDTLFDLARRTATVLLLASGRRVHDLTLLKISKDSFLDDGDNIYLIPAFGSKTDTHHYRQSAWKLSKHNDKNICPVTLVRLLIEKTATKRSEVNNLNNLFITVVSNTKAASRTVIGNWVRTVLRDSGIDASPGSCRSAVASLNWLDNQPIDDILSRGNWKSSNTFFNHYCREIELPKDSRNSFFNTFTST